MIGELVDPVQQAIEVRNSILPKDELNRVRSIVEGIISDVRELGDEALYEYTMRFDGVDLRDVGLEVSRDEIDMSYNYVDDLFIEALEKCRERIASLEEELLRRVKFEHNVDGQVIIYNDYRAIEKVGCYIPKGVHGYPSTVVMACTPAKVAGVESIYVVTPPKADGSINPSILVASDIVGVDKIYRVGGAQAVAALAFGTESVEKVYKIVGPGNFYVAMAKILLYSVVDIDMYAGPTELVVFALDDADVEKIVFDLMAQQEHGPNSLVGLVTNSKSLAKKVFDKLGEYSRKYRESRWILRRGFILYGDVEKCIAFINHLAPEHVRVVGRNSEELIDDIVNVGVLLIGDYTPSALSDYCLGTNHILPTLGWAKRRSGLSVLDYIRLVRVASASKDYLETSYKYASTVAKREGFNMHAKSLEVFLNE